MILPPANSEWPNLRHRPAAFLRRYRWPLLCLLAGATADTLTTMRALARYGAEIEVHLVQRWVVQAFGVTTGVPVAKLIQICFVLAVATAWRPGCRWLLYACATLYTLAAVSNHFELL